MYPRQQEQAHAHHQQAQLHRYHALAHQNQAAFHHQQAEFHQQQAFFANQPAYNEGYTAYNNQVSPVALVYRGHISPEALQSLQQFYNPYAGQNAQVPLSQHAAHATENQIAMQRGTRF
ncbi:hypothetical protein [Brevibacillus sp. H7]|jgi:hypothetical protein|uniref:hypothetical protein n=1 Tax=Brevibacillus sp. H7 TaxID=3349138 RepID=UPI00382E0224